MPAEEFESLAEARRLFAVVEAAKREWETTFDAFKDGIGILGRDGRLKRANTALAAMVGVDVRELPGKPCCEVFPHHRDTGCPALLAKGHRVVEFEIATPWRRCYREASFAVEGLDSVVSIISDITTEKLAKERIQRLHEEAVAANKELVASLRRLRETQEKLVASEKLASLATLAAGLAHEINNPLAFVISGVTHIKEAMGRLLRFYDAFCKGAPKTELVELAKGTRLDELGADCPSVFEDVTAGLDRIKRIVTAFSTFVEQGSCPAERIDLSQVVRDALAEYPRMPDVSMVMGLAPVPPVLASRVAVRTVLGHLIENAVFAIAKTGRPGRVTIATAERDGRVVLTVQDDGVGMTPDILAKALDPFFTTRAPGPHVGLGLTVTQAIMKRYGGDIEIRSEPSKGTVVECFFPIASTEEIQFEQAPSPNPASRT